MIMMMMTIIIIIIIITLLMMILLSYKLNDSICYLQLCFASIKINVYTTEGSAWVRRTGKVQLSCVVNI